MKVYYKLFYCLKRSVSETFKSSSCKKVFTKCVYHWYRSSHQRCSIRISVAKFTGKHLCQSLFFNKVVGVRSATLLKKRLWHKCFPVNFAKFLRAHFFTEHLRATASVDTSCFDECFSFHVITGSSIIYTNLSLPSVAAFFKTRVLKKVRILCPLSP